MSDTKTKYYHGTSIEAALGIQRSGGFSLALSGSNAGTLLGHGVYYTGNLGKAIGYAKRSGVILVLNVEMGNCKVLVPNDPMMQTWHQHGYNSAHAPQGPSGYGGLSEYCVRDPWRVTIVGMIAGDTDELLRQKMEIRGHKLVHVSFSGHKHKIDDSPPAPAGSAACASLSPKYSSRPIPPVHPAWTTSPVAAFSAASAAQPWLLSPKCSSRPIPPVHPAWTTPPVAAFSAVSVAQPWLLSPKCSSRPIPPVPPASATSTTPPVLKSFAELKTIPLLPLTGDQVERFCIVWSSDENTSEDVPTMGKTRSCDTRSGGNRARIQSNDIQKTCGLPTFGIGKQDTTLRSDYEIFQESTTKESAERTKHAACTISTNCGLKVSNMCTLEMAVPPHLQNQWVDLAMLDVGEVYQEKTGPFVVLSFETLHLLNEAMTKQAAHMNWRFTVGLDDSEDEVDVMGGFKEMPNGQNYGDYIDNVDSRAPFMIKTTTANVIDANGNVVSNTTAHTTPCPHMPSQTMTTCVSADGPAVQRGYFDLFRFVMNTANSTP